MKRAMITLAMAALCFTVRAQTTNKSLTENDPAVRVRDSLIKEQVIVPAWESSGDDAPDWTALQKQIAAKYDPVTADRVVTKGKIYFYYNKDWPLFCAGIVHYTNSYELASDFKLLNLNAGMIANYSDNRQELAEALRWAKLAAAAEPANPDYAKTCQVLVSKMAK